jgi:hypothetical protein
MSSSCANSINHATTHSALPPLQLAQTSNTYHPPTASGKLVSGKDYAVFIGFLIVLGVLVGSLPLFYCGAVYMDRSRTGLGVHEGLDSREGSVVVPGTF